MRAVFRLRSACMMMFNVGRYHERGVTGICITSAPGWDFIGKIVILILGTLQDTYEDLVYCADSGEYSSRRHFFVHPTPPSPNLIDKTRDMKPTERSTVKAAAQVLSRWRPRTCSGTVRKLSGPLIIAGIYHRGFLLLVPSSYRLQTPFFSKLISLSARSAGLVPLNKSVPLAPRQCFFLFSLRAAKGNAVQSAQLRDFSHYKIFSLYSPSVFTLPNSDRLIQGCLDNHDYFKDRRSLRL